MFRIVIASLLISTLTLVGTAWLAVQEMTASRHHLPSAIAGATQAYGVRLEQYGVPIPITRVLDPGSPFYNATANINAAGFDLLVPRFPCESGPDARTGGFYILPARGSWKDALMRPGICPNQTRLSSGLTLTTV